MYPKRRHKAGASQPGTAVVLEVVFMNIIYCALTLVMMTQGHQAKIFIAYMIFDKTEHVVVIFKSIEMKLIAKRISS